MITVTDSRGENDHKAGCLRALAGELESQHRAAADPGSVWQGRHRGSRRATITR